MFANEAYRQLKQMIYSLDTVSLEICRYKEPLILSPAPSHRIGFVKNIKGTMEENGKRQLVEAGDVFLIKPKTSVSLRTEQDKELEVFFIAFSYWIEQNETGKERVFVPGGDNFPLEGTFRVRSHSQVLHLMEELHKSYASNEEREQFRQRLLFERILYILVKDFSSIESNENTMASIEETILYVDQHYMLNLTLEMLAGKANVSPSYYSRMFKTLKGVSFSDYMTNLRINRAKVLLRLSGSRLREVAQSVGYNDEFYFSKMFKKVVGQSPSEYVKSHMRQDNS
ncbi:MULTISPECIES: response regulator transcription factor [Brevibacillus]|uniref:AraC family transcriptional regulator n=1 Tax=Brevibacillus brevis TaxID=1393 RepID=A0A2Z4MNL8_BREBE|nr:MULTISPECIES: response regulator transcription factor [Brevibacillus]AWX57941.1 AraC family transcriptional regulator [Brevibacillus brevis]NRR21290.1 AraC family transcriptional regulator [Brevibacillus sp. MS2.2]